ncbi:MAG: ComF family protein [Paracoccaceae bacterium]
MIYPPQCLDCGAPVERDGALCPDCWRDCEFVTGCACQRCGVPLPGMAGLEGGGDAALICDDCLAMARPWRQARAALVYRDVGRDLVLALKHGDRPDLALPLGGWLAAAASPLVRPSMIVVPIPLHPRRLLSRKFNQAALLSAQVARAHGLAHLPTLLQRCRATPAQDHRDSAARHENLRGALAVTPRHRDRLAGQAVLLVDDVMASGATMTEAVRALHEAGAGPVSVAVLARAVKG